MVHGWQSEGCVAEAVQDGNEEQKRHCVCNRTMQQVFFVVVITVAAMAEEMLMSAN
jgi:hypothetical protein